MKKEEITDIIKSKIASFKKDVSVDEIGTIVSVGDGIARIQGLNNAFVSELLEFPKNIFGMALNLEQEEIGCILFGDEKLLKEGDIVKRTRQIMEVPVGEHLIGRIINPLGFALDGKDNPKMDKKRAIEVVAPSIAERQPVKIPLQTGIKAIDSMIPIGRGQRELIIGDRQIGKTAIVIDTIINQKNEENRPICIYVAIGQKQSTIASIFNTLKKFGADEYTIIVAASASDAAPLLYLAPYSGCAIAEEFMWAGKDVLIIYDDLSKHAQAYRQISLLLRRPPGREAYPGDVFYLHSRLLERACKLSDKNGSGSITALPIIETQAGDISAYIPTNVISITDGQIYLENNLFYSGIRPATNVGLSVSRVGGSAQVKSMRQVAGSLRIDIAQYNELSSFAQFSSELDTATKSQIIRGERLVEILKQDQYEPLEVEKQILIIFAGTKGLLDDIEISKIKSFEKGLYNYCIQNNPEILSELKLKREISKELEAKLNSTLKEYKKAFISL
ncbi:MAG TPA: F0F1 ATP synthase subunit alpha [Elusimicrobia bacterium]|nr:MAG: F0F1 ATP synthase subunit alpha [Elusimicrobia bacterium RIFOXYD2_FULL_34_30]HAM38029.1 F0F1 ATP synthase subunit alpha [Elusimicrobiota bacterium]